MQNPPMTMLKRAFRDFPTVTHCYSLVVAFCVICMSVLSEDEVSSTNIANDLYGENKTELLGARKWVSRSPANQPTS